MTKILVVDDNDMVRETIELLIRTATDWEVVALRNGQACLDHPLDGVNCILLDLRMPNLSGWDVLKALRLRGSKVPVVLMSGHARELDDMPEPFPIVSAFLPKPFSGVILLNTIREAIGSNDH
ncbi:MAG: response regulator [Pseudomonadales bacterium]|nr:response regulator [Pseudomonadales bacterium]